MPWNTNEPNNCCGREEDYAHVTSPNVEFQGPNDLQIQGDASGDFQPKGYIVSTAECRRPVLQISGVTTIRFPRISDVEGATFVDREQR